MSSKKSKAVLPVASMEEINREDVQFIEEHDMIFVDIEASGLKRPISIVQIGAISESGEVFNEYMIPFKQIEIQASKMTGLSLRRGSLRHHGVPVFTQHPQSVFEQFATWVEKVCKKPATLVAYNGLTYDFPVLAKHARSCQVRYEERVRKDGKMLLKGLLDPLVYMKKAFPENKKFNQEHMLNQFGVETEGDAHSAIADAINLKRLFEALTDQERATSIVNVPGCFRDSHEFLSALPDLEEI